MEKISEFLKMNTNGSLATVDDGKPQVRPWGFMMSENGRFYFCTSNKKEVYQQIKKNPSVVFTSTSQQMVTVRLSGEAVFTEDLAVKEKVLNQYDMVKGIYKTPDNPIFEVFYLAHGKAVLSDFSGQPPKTFIF